MNISYNWLRELTEVRLGPRELSERLTSVGLIVDGVHEAGDDYVFDIDLTSNRPDCLSHLGVAREVAAFESGSVNLPDTRATTVEGRAVSFTSIEIEDTELCPRYAARVVRGVKIGPSPAWLVKRLEAIGQRPINNVADITNYVMHELGQPLHAFDLPTLAERRIVVRRARAGERIKTLDGVERELDEEMLVIADAARPVAIAGVMGGEATEISATTCDVLIESAYFSPASVRRTSKALGLQTEASYRFERGTDYEGVRRAQDRCVALICEIAGGAATEDAVDIYPQKIEPPVVTLRPRRVEELTGLGVPSAESLRILSALGFEADGDGARGVAEDASSSGDAFSEAPEGESKLSFKVPTWRVDVGLEEDLVEEVARHYGYEKIGESLPTGGTSGEYRQGDYRRRAAFRALTAAGFNEAISFSFIDAAHDGEFESMPGLAGAAGEAEGDFVTLSNPIIEAATRMRPTLLSGLLGALRHNFNHGTRNVRLFESGRVFRAAPAGRELPNEQEALALVLTGGALEEGRAAAARELDFYDAKGALEAATDAMNVGELRFEAASVRHLREGQAARVLVGGRAIGTLGRLAEELSAAYKFRQPVFVAEVNFRMLLEAAEVPVRYTPLARFPSVVRDISLVAGRRVAFEEMRRAALGLGMEHCRGVALVDVYEGANLPEGKRSLTLRVEYRADERTLRDEEVDEMHARIVESLGANFGAQLRA
ncbi:MAG TPA: phenylalanine--tRNA ligase subunit beta [Pyrinomonadaceae bacterium]|nr:phenylalanine--tRNA ligase subunit beta [Pyrinomonadaceae bacterium]